MQNKPQNPLSSLQVVLLCALGGGFLWAYWPTLSIMAGRWLKDQQYSHGWLVPAFAVFLLWMRRKQLKLESIHPSWWGLGLFAAGMVMRLAGTLLYVNWLDNYSLLPCVAGLVVLLGGWPLFRWAWPGVMFLFFMIPLPYVFETALAYQLRLIATQTSTYALQTFGFPAMDEGTNIHLRDELVQIAPACSGMGMLLIFFALSTAIVLLVERSWVDKVVILVSAIPIAVIANIVRITVTATMYELARSMSSEQLRERANSFFHDGAGYLMMLVGLFILWVELKVLAWLIVEVDDPHTVMAMDFSDVRGGRHRAHKHGA